MGRSTYTWLVWRSCELRGWRSPREMSRRRRSTLEVRSLRPDAPKSMPDSCTTRRNICSRSSTPATRASAQALQVKTLPSLSYPPTTQILDHTNCSESKQSTLRGQTMRSRTQSAETVWLRTGMQPKRYGRFRFANKLTGVRPNKALQDWLNDPQEVEKRGGLQKAMAEDVNTERCLEEHPLFMTEPSWNPAKAREKCAEIALESWASPAFYLGRTGVMGAFGAGKSSALVVDFGASQLSVTPVHDGMILKKGVMRSNLGGNYISSQVRSMFATNEPQPITIIPHYLVQSKQPVDAGQASASCSERVLCELGCTVNLFPKVSGREGCSGVQGELPAGLVQSERSIPRSRRSNSRASNTSSICIHSNSQMATTRPSHTSASKLWSHCSIIKPTSQHRRGPRMHSCTRPPKPNTPYPA